MPRSMGELRPHEHLTLLIDGCEHRLLSSIYHAPPVGIGIMLSLASIADHHERICVEETEACLD